MDTGLHMYIVSETTYTGINVLCFISKKKGSESDPYKKSYIHNHDITLQIRGDVMQVSKRRKEILKILDEKGPLSYREILDEASISKEYPIKILSDLDTLVFFRFLQKEKAGKSKLTPETRLEIRPETKKQMTDDLSRVFSRLKELEHEIPPWYRKLAILKVLSDQEMVFEEIKTILRDQFPHVRWHPILTKTSLRILKRLNFVFTDKEASEKYKITPEGKELLKKCPIQKFLSLRILKDEFTNEFRTFVILNTVGEHEETGGISSKRIIRYLQTEYGIRGNKKRAVLNTLESMVLTGLLVSERNVYHLSPMVKFFLEMKKPLIRREVTSMNDYHTTQDLKKTVDQFFEKYEIPNLREDIKASIRQILYDLEQCDKDLSLRSTEVWVDHIAFLSGCLQDFTADTWKKRFFRCIIACILSRLLLPKVSVNILLDHPPPFPPSEEHRRHYEGIAREYYFNLTEGYLNLGENETAFQSFSHLEILSWESFEFLILKGTVEMKKGRMREAIMTFEKASELSERDEKIVALFHRGLAQYQRGDFDEAKKIWEECLNLQCTADQEIIVRHNLANAYRMSGKLEKARMFYEDSIVFAERLGKEEFKVESDIGLANILVELCLWKKAERKLKEIIQECTENEFPLVLALAQTNLGVLSGRKGKHEEALACHKEALDMVNRESNPREYCMILVNKGDTLRQLKRTDEALAVLQEARELAGSENKVLIQAIKISLADVYVDNGDTDKGWELSHAVLQERWLGNGRSEAEARRIQGAILLRKNDFKKAKESLKESERIFKELNLQYELLQIYTLLETCCKKLEDKEREVHYREKREALIQKVRVPE